MIRWGEAWDPFLEQQGTVCIAGSTNTLTHDGDDDDYDGDDNDVGDNNGDGDAHDIDDNEEDGDDADNGYDHDEDYD